MKRFSQFILVFMLSSGMVMLANARGSKNKTASEKEIYSTQLQLQDKKQNLGTTQSREQNQLIHGAHFVNKDGNGFEDNTPDHDKDGIPNGQDPDYEGAGKNQKKKGFVDINGDGIADNGGQGNGARNGKAGRGGYGPGDGTGFGPGATSGNCDRTVPKGRNNRSGRK